MRKLEQDRRAGEGASRDGGPFWSEHQPGFRFTDAEHGSPAFFAEVESHRYALEPAIRELVRFDEWAGRDVLEVGCGIATDGLQFARANARYTGLDASPAALALARRHFELEGLEPRFVEGSVTALPFADRSFDMVYSNGVLHHIEDTERAVEEIRRVLRPGGTALVVLYHRDSFNYRVGIMLVRRALAAVLLLRGATRAVARLSGERTDVIEGHRALLAEHGLGYLRDRELFLSNNTDGPGNPLSKVYSRADARRPFGQFASVHTEMRFLNLRIYPGGAPLSRSSLARRLERRFGWHLWIRATRDGAAAA